MYKNQLQELAQRSCFNLPSYSCIREDPDHATRFKATVNFINEIFESPNFCTTLRQSENSAAEVALNSLSLRGPSHSFAARILISHTVVESFGACGKKCITTRVYPTLAVGNEAHLYAFNNGTETVEIKRLNAWTMKTPKMNLRNEICSSFAAKMSQGKF